MFFKAFEIERRSFSTDYMEWNLRSSARLRRTPGARDDREREAEAEGRSRHRDEQQDQDPGHRRPLLGHGEADSWLVRQRTGRPLDNALKMLEHAAERAAQGEQGTEVKLCPLRLNTTEGALKKEARFNSTANGDGRSRRARSRESSAGPASQRTEPDRT